VHVLFLLPVTWQQVSERIFVNSLYDYLLNSKYFNKTDMLSYKAMKNKQD